MRAALLALVACGCGAPTSLGLDVSLAGGLAEPDSLRVTLYGAGRLGAQTAPLASAGKALPGRLVITPVDAGAPNFRWLLEGLDPLGAVTAQAAASTALAAGRETDVAALLASKLTDTDADGVPDAIDDCPITPDPEQNCATPRDLGGALDGGGATCPPAAILCEDFESGSFATNGWTIGSFATGDSVVIDGVRPHSGALAMHGAGMSLQQSHHAAIDHGLTAAQTIAVRQWVYLAKPPGPFAFYLQLYTPTIGASIGTDDVGNWVLSEDLGSTNNDHTTMIATPVGAWTCIELVATQAGGAQRLQGWADGQLLVDFAPQQNYAFTDLFIGAARIPSGSDAEVFLDDVAVAPARVGCD